MMKLIERFWHLPRPDKRALFEALWLVSLIRVGLTVLPFKRLWRLTDRLAGAATRRADDAYRDRMVWAIKRVGWRLLGDRPCLTQALAARFTFARMGYPAEVRIGVAKADDGSLKAHAWVESEGRIVIGGATSPFQFKPLPKLEID